MLAFPLPLALLLAAAPLPAASAQGVIEGVVVDRAGRGLAGAWVVALPSELGALPDPLAAAVALRAQSRLQLEPRASTDPEGRFALALPPAAAGGWVLVATRAAEARAFPLGPFSPWVSSAALPAAGQVRLELPLVRVELQPAGVAAGEEPEGRLVCRELRRDAHHEDWEWSEPNRPLEPRLRRSFHARPGTTLLCAWIAPDGRYAQRVLEVPPDAALLGVPLELPQEAQPGRLEVRLVGDFGTAPAGRQRVSVHDPRTGLALVASEGDAPRHTFRLPPGPYLVRSTRVAEPFHGLCGIDGPPLEPLGRAGSQELVLLRAGETVAIQAALERGGLLRLELPVPEAHLHPLLAAWRRGEREAGDLAFLALHGELPAGAVRLEDPRGLPTPPLAWASLGFGPPPGFGPPYAGPAPGLPAATSYERLPAGRHVLLVDMPRFQPSRVAIDVPEGGELEVRLELAPIGHGAR